MLILFKPSPFINVKISASVKVIREEFANALPKNKSAKAAAKEEAIAKKTDVKVKEVKTATKKEIKAVVKEVKKTVAKAKKSEIKEAPKTEISANDDIQISFKKNLTPREQAVFEHFLNNKNHIVYAKELAQVLELPRD